MDLDLNKLVAGMQSVSQAEIDDARNAMLLNIAEWVENKYPKIRLATVERNIAAFTEIKKYDDQCKKCMSTAQCPTQDGNRMNGRLDADGIVTIWMEPCPHGHKPLKHQTDEPKTKRWGKRGDG